MKILKGIFYFIMALIMAGCLGILICVFNPNLTKMLAEKVGNAQAASSGGTELLPSGTGDGLSADTQPEPGVNTGWITDGNGYQRPDSIPSNTPASVSGKTGYEPVQEEGQQIAQSEADNLSGIIAPGDTGEDLTFDESFYPYYAMLEQDMRRIYHQIYANALNLTVSFTPVSEVSVSQLKTVFEAVYNDHPELFWLDSGYYCKYLRNGNCVEITLKYHDTANYLESAKQEFEAAAQVILPGAQALGSEQEREQYVHDALMEMVEYDADAPMNQSAYSALVGGRSVCAGYARAFQYLMQQLGIPCYYCTGYAGEDHAWNIVKLGEIYRNVDVTWDDTNPATYDYYNKTDREYADTHMRTDLSVYLPACLVDASGGASGEGITGSSAVSDLINPNPTTPLGWQSRARKEDEDTGPTADERKKANLEIAGITEDQVRETAKEYYEDCLKLLKEVGTGDKQFSNVVPESLWTTLEQAYGNGEFWKGYAEEGLKALGVENFVVQIQVQRLGGGYFRLYHNVYTY